MRDLVAGGDIDLVLAQDRDRTRDPIITGWLQIQFEQHGTRLRALNDLEGDDATTRLTTGILDQIAQVERAMTTQRTRRGWFQRARGGKVIGSGSPPYGFKYNADRTNYEVDPDTMPTVKRLFDLVAAGHTLHSVAPRFTEEGLPTPGGGKHWYVPSLRRMILNGVYKGPWGVRTKPREVDPDGEKRGKWEAMDLEELVERSPSPTAASPTRS